MDNSFWESNPEIQAMMKASPLAIIAIGRDGNVRAWNSAAQRMFGWSEAEVLGRPPHYVPKEKQAEFRLLLNQTMRGECASGLELQCQGKDGTPIDVSLWAVPIREGAGQVLGILSVLAKITERKRVEEALAVRTRQLEAVREERDAHRIIKFSIPLSRA